MKKVFRIKLKGITKLLAVVIVASLATLTGCKSYDADIDDLNTDIAALKTELTNLKDGAVASATTKIAALEAEVADLKANGATDAELAAVKAEILSKTVSIEALNAYKLAVTAEIAAATSTLATKAELNAKILEVNTTLTQLGAEVTALKGEVTAAVASIATLKAEVEARLAIIEGLLNIQNGRSTVLDGFTTQLADQLALINTNAASITAIQAELVTIKADIAANTASINELNAKLLKTNNNMKALAQAVSLNFDVLSSRLSSLTYVPELFVNGIEAMNFSPLKSACMTITPSLTVAYHLNPSFITAADIETDNMSFEVIESQNMQSVKGANKAKTAAAVKANFVKIENGKLYVAVSIQDFNALFTGNVTGGALEKFSMIALQVPLSEKAVKENKLDFDADGNLVTVGNTTFPADRVVTSQYVRLYNKEITAPTDVFLARNITGYPAIPQTVAGAKAWTVKDVDSAVADDAMLITLAFGDSLNLMDKVLALYSGAAFDVEKYGLKFKFDLLDDASPAAPIVYKRGANNVDQQQFITVTNATKGTIKATAVTQAQIASSQGRTPIVRVTMYNDQDPTCSVLMGFVKIHLAEKAYGSNFKFATEAGPCTDQLAVLTPAQMLDSIYKKAGMTKAVFHATYPNTPTEFSYTGDGVVAYTNGDNELNWKLTALQIWTKLTAVSNTTDSATFTATAVYKSITPSVYPDFTVKFTRTYKKPAAFNILEANLIKKYWFDMNGENNATVFDEVKHNVHVPNVNDNTTTLCTIENDISQAFLQNANKSLLGLANYEYFFLANQPTLTDAATTKLTVSNDGKQLLNGTEVVATINPFVANTGDILVLNQASATAKRLLNAGQELLRARVGVRTVYCETLPQFVRPVTVNGKTSFDVAFVRPIKAAGVSPDEFVDAKTFGQPNTYIEIAKMVSLSDWRNYSFATYPNLYGYYGISSIELSTTEEIETNLNGTRVVLSTYPGLQVAYAANVPGVTPVAPYGYLTYKNNGQVIGGDFELYVPVTIKYHWGEIVNTWVTVEVYKTIGPSGVKRK